jgi:hypothetical protein
MGDHIVNGQFQSDKYTWCEPGFLALKLTDRAAQPLIWEYAQTHRAIDSELSDDLETALRNAGYPVRGHLLPRSRGRRGSAVPRDAVRAARNEHGLVSERGRPEGRVRRPEPRD